MIDTDLYVEARTKRSGLQRRFAPFSSVALDILAGARDEVGCAWMREALIMAPLVESGR